MGKRLAPPLNDQSPPPLIYHCTEGWIFLSTIPPSESSPTLLDVKGPREDIQAITPHLSHPAPLLEDPSIRGYKDIPHFYPALPLTLFNGDLSSLRVLCLELVRTELPWRNMVNLTSFTLVGAVSIRRLLDFFGSVPYLKEVKICSETPTTGAQNGRLVSLVSKEHVH